MARATATKLDPALWEQSKRDAIRRMGGVFSARAMQLAVQIYKARGGRYKGPKTGREGLSKWTREKWQTRPGTPKVATRKGTTARYLPAKAWAQLSPAEQRATDAKKRRACKGVKGPCFISNTPKAKQAGKRARAGRVAGCPFVAYDRMSHEQAHALYRRAYREGRHGVEPLEMTARMFSTRPGPWVVAHVPLVALDYQGEADSGPDRLARAYAYARSPGRFPPGVAFYGERSRARKTRRAWVADGNHRALAAFLRGDCAALMLMPEEDYVALVEAHG